MAISTTPHLNFDGDARAALDFYAAAFGTEAVAMTYGRMGASDDPAWADRIVWGQVETAAGVRVMAFDVWPGQPYDQGRNAFYVFLSGDDAEEITAAWHGLADGAEVLQPLGPSAWSPLAGRLRDRFGVVWQLDVRAATTEDPAQRDAERASRSAGVVWAGEPVRRGAARSAAPASAPMTTGHGIRDLLIKG